MKVKFNRPEGEFEAGQVVDLPDPAALRHIRRGAAEAVDVSPKRPDPEPSVDLWPTAPANLIKDVASILGAKKGRTKAQAVESVSAAATAAGIDHAGLDIVALTEAAKAKAE